MRLRLLTIVLLTMTFAAWASQAFAQLSRVGVSQGLVTASVMRGTDVAYDSRHGVYLVVGSHGTLYGVFTDRNGSIVGSQFTIGDGNGVSVFAQFPRVEFNPDWNGGYGAFLVTWHQNDGAPNFVHSLLIAYGYGVMSSNSTLSDGSQGGTFWEMGAAVAYSTTSHVYFVVWRTLNYGIQGRYLDQNGAPIGGVVPIENPGCSRDPGVAWNSATDEFGVSYTAFCGDANPGAYAAFRHIPALAPLPSGRTSFGFSGTTFITDIDVNTATHHYVMGWSDGGTTQGAEFDPSGTLLATRLLAIGVGSYDSIGLGYNDVSGTFLLVGHSTGAEVAGAELNSNGVPISGATILTNGGGTSGSFYPRTTGATGTNTWNISYSRQLTTITDQIVTTASNGAAPPTPAPTSPPPPPTSTPGACPGSDPFAAIGGGTCVNGGWQPPSSVGGSTGGCPGTAPFSGAVCVAGGWVPGSGSSTSTGGCPGTAPFPNAVCSNGGWVPGNPTSPLPSLGGCVGAAPFANAVCVNGGWVPGGSQSLGGCAGSAPFAGAICVNGGWVPGGSQSLGGCAGSAPFAGAICVNGGWVPGGSASLGCSTSVPVSGWVCVGGGWVPPDSPLAAGASLTTVGGSGCATPNPFANIPGMTGVCIAGGWVPNTNPMAGGRP